MYLSFFNLREHPFSLTPDPRFLFLSPQHEEALSHLLYGIQERKGFIEITGEVGTGKTILCRALLDRLDTTVSTALIFNSYLNELELLQAITHDFGLVCQETTRKGYIDALNEAVKGAPAGMTIGVHVCRGNYKGMYLSEGGYDSVAEKFFGRVDVDHFLLEFDTPRAGGFAPLRFVPTEKGVVLGLVSSKTPVLESIDVLKRRTDEAAKYVDIARLAISPQCGFASTMGGNPVTEEDERAKLKLCARAAQAIWND